MPSPGRNGPVQRRPHSRRSIASVPSSGTVENMTADVSALHNSTQATLQTEKTKKSRSKSLGPGGLDALQDDAGNRRKSTVNPAIKSILKPSLPISPPKAIPSFEATRKKSPGRPKSKASPGKSKTNEGILIDFASAPSENAENAPVTGAENLVNPFDVLQPGTVAVRTEEEQQASAREREEKEKRDQQRQAILDQRAARRKSLANRRVSFAPEATLHTWVNMEVGEDSTTSSASTNSTRRASSLAAPSTPRLANSDPPSTPPEQVEERAPEASPAHQRDLHQKKRRRSSGIPPMDFNNPNTDFSSSPYSGSSAAGSDDTGHTVRGDGVDDSSDSDDDTVTDGENTGMSLVSQENTGESGSSTSSSGRLEAALRQAAAQAGTRGIDFDENGDESMEMAEEEITASFQPWVKKGVYAPQVVQDQENLNPFSPAFKVGTSSIAKQAAPTIDEDEEEMSMDVTKAIGGILKQQSPKASPKGQRKSIAPSRRSSVARRRSSGGASDMDDATMEFTTAIGGIQQPQPQPQSPLAQENDESAIDEDEDMTMEFTGVIGGVINNQPSQNDMIQSSTSKSPRRESFGSVAADDTMDMTAAVGGILAPIEERTEPSDSQTMAMDVTTAIGCILPAELHTTVKSQAKKLMELETDAGQLASSPFQERTSPISPPKSAPKSATPKYLATVASETGSPSLANVRGRGPARRSQESRLSATPKISSHPGTPIKGPSTPSKQLTPLPGKATTPSKTPPMSNVTFRSASPKKLFKAEIKKAITTPKSEKSQKTSTPQKLFQKDAITGEATPSVVLKPGRRRSSGLGIDKEGLGSPQVEALFDRRGSIGDEARKFIADDQPTRGVRFENPRVLQQEIDRERDEEERRESGRGILEQEADIQDEEDNDVTANLKEMIESLTPKKERKKLNGRKSLAVGAAKGLLGKRPVELDEDEEDRDEDVTPKRLKGREGSPVKNVKLPTPAQNMGRTTRATRKSFAEIAGNPSGSTITPTTSVSPLKVNATTPKHQGRFKDAEPSSASKPSSFEDKMDSTVDHIYIAEADEVAEQQEEQERIHLQDFLNMTNIHFMDLNTTKRRHTTAPGSAKKLPSTQGGGSTAPGVEDCVVAALCTVPMLELYQHSCRELKSYISEGRRLIRSIESSTFEEQPPLFREYLSAPPDVRIIMDTQFRNVKTHARLLSKGMWYEWRMKLLEGLREGLDRHVEGMNADDLALRHEEAVLEPMVQDLLFRHETLSEDVRILREREEEAENEDEFERAEARGRLGDVEQRLSNRKQHLQKLEQQRQDNDRRIEASREMKTEFEAQIKEAERVREECRGWSVKEVNEARSSASVLEKSTGWTITSVSFPDSHAEDFGTALSLTYKSTLRLFFHPEAFLKPGTNTANLGNVANAPISLTFAPSDGAELRTEKRFFLQLLQGHVHSLSQGSSTSKELLNSISSSWDTATTISSEVETLNLLGVTSTEILSDEELGVRTMVMQGSGAETARIDFAFKLHAAFSGAIGKLDVDVKANARVVYGDLKSSTAELASSLRAGIKNQELGTGVWAQAVRKSVFAEGGADAPSDATVERKAVLTPKTGIQTPGPGRKTPGRKVLAGMSGNVVLPTSALAGASAKTKTPARLARAPAQSPVKISTQRSPVKAQSPVKTPPRTLGRKAKAQEEAEIGVNIAGESVVGEGIDANGMTTPVKLRRGGIPRTPPGLGL